MHLEDYIGHSCLPVNKKWNIEKLISACKEYQKVTTRRISFEYAMINGVNDTDQHAELLSKILRGIMCHVNLIPANPVVETDFVKSDNNRINRFKECLEKNKITATIRPKRIAGANGNEILTEISSEINP